MLTHFRSSPPGLVANMDRLVERLRYQGGRICIVERDCAWSGPMAGDWTAQHDCLLDIALTPRVAARGSFVEAWDGRRTEPIGDIFFVPPGVTFRGYADKGRQCSLACYFPRALFAEVGLDAALLSDAALADSLHLDGVDLRRLAADLIREIETPAPAGDAMIEAIATALAITIGRRLMDDARRRSGGLAPRAMRLIESQLDRVSPPPRVAELAASCGISVRHLARAFRQETGQTLSAHIAMRRIARAECALVAGDRPIKQIATEAGFASASAFIAAFRKLRGETPNDYRARVRAAA